MTCEAKVYDAATGRPVTAEPLQVDLGEVPAGAEPGPWFGRVQVSPDGSGALFSVSFAAEIAGGRYVDPSEARFPFRLWDIAGGRLTTLDLPPQVVSRWASFHGVSLNVEPDLSHFEGIIPCGIREHGVTSLVDLGLPVTMADLDAALMATFPRRFQGSCAA